MKIFISYAHEDAAHMLSIQQALEIHEVWFDQRLSLGQAWWEEIEQQIARSHCFVYLLSPHSLQSEYCQKELELALRLQKPIAPVMVATMDIPENVSRFQVIPVLNGFTSDAIVRLLNGILRSSERCSIRCTALETKKRHRQPCRSQNSTSLRQTCVSCECMSKF